MFRFIESEGQILGEEVIRVMTMTKGQSTDEVRIAGYQKSVVCPGRARNNGDPMDPKTREGQNATYVDAPPVELRVGLLGLGPVALTSINTEVYTAIGLDIKARSPMRNTIIVTLADERVGGYVPDDASYGHQTFQVLNSSLKPGCAQLASSMPSSKWRRGTSTVVSVRCVARAREGARDAAQRGKAAVIGASARAFK